MLNLKHDFLNEAKSIIERYVSFPAPPPPRPKVERFVRKTIMGSHKSRERLA